MEGGGPTFPIFIMRKNPWRNGLNYLKSDRSQKAVTRSMAGSCGFDLKQIQSIAGNAPEENITCRGTGEPVGEEVKNVDRLAARQAWLQHLKKPMVSEQVQKNLPLLKMNFEFCRTCSWSRIYEHRFSWRNTEISSLNNLLKYTAPLATEQMQILWGSTLQRTSSSEKTKRLLKRRVGRKFLRRKLGLFPEATHEKRTKTRCA